MLPLIGGHVSAAGGLATAIDRAEAIGADAIQIFGASPRQWAVRIPSEAEISAFCERQKRSRVQNVFLHAAYLVNLASPDVETRKKSVVNLAAHLRIARAIRSDGLIFHIGSGHEMPHEEAIQAVADGITEIFAAVPGHTPLLMENAAGGGKKLGATAEDFQLIMAHVRSERLKACFDTAHAFEAGMIEAYTSTAIRSLFDAWDAAIGLEKILALHVNDSKTVFNSHHDRHENIGKGHIGLAGFRHLAAETRLHRAAWLLEVPGFANEGPDRKNVEILKKCFRK